MARPQQARRRASNVSRRRFLVACCITLLGAECGHGQHGGGSSSADRECTGVRPPGNTGNGFFTHASTIYDANGCPFIPMGFNALVYWQEDRAAQVASIDVIASQGANAVRIVTQ